MLTLGGIGYTYVFNDQFNSKYRIRKRNYNILCQLFFWYVQRGIYKYVSSYSKGNVLVIIDFAVVLYMYIRVNNRTLPIVSHRYIFYAFFFITSLLYSFVRYLIVTRRLLQSKLVIIYYSLCSFVVFVTHSSFQPVGRRPLVGREQCGTGPLMLVERLNQGLVNFNLSQLTSTSRLLYYIMNFNL